VAQRERRGRVWRASKRLVLATLFAATAAAFALPFLHVVEQREAKATGIQLVAGRASFSGEYVNPTFEGEVEQTVERGFVHARLAFGFACLGVALAFAPGRWGYRLGLVGAALGLVTLGTFYLATTPVIGPENERLSGFWLALALFVAAGAFAVLRLRREPDVRLQEPEWLRSR
jgi:hypothetical protein